MTLILNGSVGVSDVDGSAATPAIRGTDANTGMFFPAADTIAFAEGGTEVMRIDNSGNVGIGTSSPAAVAGKHLQIGTKTHLMQLTVNDVSYLTNNIWYNGTNWIADTTGASSLIGVGSTGFVAYNAASVSGGSVATLVGSLAVDLSGNLQFNSGYGGVATAYGCRAWVNFNGTGTVAIRASGNVTSITDNGTGDYTVNITTAMPDANYAIGVSGAQGTDETNRGLAEVVVAAYTTSSFKLRTGYNVGGNVATDYAIVNAVVLR